MKTKYISTAAIGLCIIALSACNEPDPYGEKQAAGSQLSVGSSYISFNLTRSNTVDVIASEGLGWSARCDQSWVRIDNVNGVGSKPITVSVTEDNPTTQKRPATITLTSNRYNRTATINVEQEGTYLRVTEDKDVNFLQKGGQETKIVESNATWEIDKKPTWVNAAISGDKIGTSTLNLSAEANPIETDREDYVVLKNAAIEKRIRVTQSKLLLEVNTTPLEFKEAGGQKTLTVTSNADWTVRSSKSWCTVEPRSDSGTKNITIKVSQNTESARSAILTFTSGNITREVEVKQEGHLSLTMYTTNFKAEGDWFFLTITPPSNQSWTASSNYSWVHFSKDENYSEQKSTYSGTGTERIRVYTDSNPYFTGRSAKITVKCGTTTETVEITQDGLTNLVLKDLYTYPLGNVYVNIRTASLASIKSKLKENNYVLSYDVDRVASVRTTGNDILKGLKYKDIPFYQMWIQFFTTGGRLIEYTFSINKTELSSGYSKYTEIVSDLEKTFNVSLTSKSLGNNEWKATVTKNNINYYVNLKNDSDNWSFEIQLWLY